jgi:hypothetical protein
MSGNLQTAFGYRDNVQLSAFEQERSTFVRSGLNVALLHSNVPATRADYWVALWAAGTHYFTAKTFKEESEVYLLGQWNYKLGERWKFSLTPTAYALDQIYDVSDTELAKLVTKIKTSGVGLNPALRWDVTKAWWAKIEATGKRENTPDGFNNRTGREASARLGWKPWARFEASVAGTERRRDYDSRDAYDALGQADTSQRLQVAEREGELRLQTTLDRAEEWQLVTRLSTVYFTDNSGGFLDFHSRKVTAELSWTADKWKVILEGSARRVNYDVQTVGSGFVVPHLFRDGYTAKLQVERALSERWRVYAEYNWARDRSNEAAASYSLNEGLLGIRWNWEK